MTDKSNTLPRTIDIYRNKARMKEILTKSISDEFYMSVHEAMQGVKKHSTKIAKEIYDADIRNKNGTYNRRKVGLVLKEKYNGTIDHVKYQGATVTHVPEPLLRLLEGIKDGVLASQHVNFSLCHKAMGSEHWSGCSRIYSFIEKFSEIHGQHPYTIDASRHIIEHIIKEADMTPAHWDRGALCGEEEVRAKMTGGRAGKANDMQVGGDHYRSDYYDDPQHWDFAAAMQMDYFQGQVTKYVCRWKKKNGVEDLKKAAHFLQKYIELQEEDDAD